MLFVGAYRREQAVEYARRWAFSRNPLFYDFSALGGDCTNFVSQCVYAGSCVMNLTPVLGWYYVSPGDRAAAFSGVEFFYNFLVGNEGVGPYATETDAEGIALGDVIELGRADGSYYHTLLAVGRDEGGDILVAAHTNDAFARPLSSYTFEAARYLHIEGVRYLTEGANDCFPSLLLGERLLLVGAGEVLAPLPEGEGEDGQDQSISS